MTRPGSCARIRQSWQLTELVNTLLSASAREVVRHWISCQKFLDADNEPTLLPISSPGEAGFTSLVGHVNRELAPTVIFNELLRKGIVEQNDSGCLLLRRSAYVPGLPYQGDSVSIAEDDTSYGNSPRRRLNDC
ncbi:hypothetical protein DIT71_03030 [Marinobacter vulgaris]|uniref:Uncharacterized protein n=1 Tax=Marinobacter vulgaris TaxID=1928331 RepID=A0A2V3ZU81_9GAMM|nr:hypothetical protein [Marinobacter vulgaris]PXX93786.1 hypothetical protein DIT71_03030 [Marinobacter vulgaris]TSJ72195.1 hypothetical protein FPC41_00245 [Marinobacter vulgaris]